jgi:septum formation topological specificity factor MinE
VYVPVSRAKVDVNVEMAVRIRAVKNDRRDIAEPQHRLGSQSRSAEKFLDLLQVVWRHLPVDMDQVWVNREEHHPRMLIEVRELAWLYRKPGEHFGNLNFLPPD